MLRIKIALVVSLLLAFGAMPAMADEGDESGDTTEETHETEDHDRAAFMVANLLAAEFGTTLEEVQELHELGLGLGSTFKLESLALALGTDVMSLLATFEVNEDGEYEFGWGELKKTLTEEQLEVLDGLPKNLGQIVSAAKKHDDGEEGGDDDVEAADQESKGKANGKSNGKALGHGKGKGKNGG